MSGLSPSDEAKNIDSSSDESSEPEEMIAGSKKKKKMSLVSRILLLVGAGLLVASSFLPWWSLDLLAPQYPEGLAIVLYPDRLGGKGEHDLDNINVLNHYIGMEKISEEGFPELQYIKYIVWGVAAFVAGVALLGMRKLAYVACALFVVGAALGLYDMYHWLHTFGSNLNPDAPITIAPFAPPMVGENQLANFTTYSSFRIGFYLLAAGGISVFVGTWGDLLWSKKRS